MRPFDNNGDFKPSVAGTGDSLRRAAVRSAGMTIFSGGLALGIQVVATVVLSRLLVPKDFGIVAMVTSFSLLLSNFGLNGITEAVVQREEMDDGVASTLFWITVSGGAFLTFAFAASGTLLAKFYAEPVVARVTVGMAPTILLTSVSVLHLGLLKRAMQFSVVSVNDIVARVASVVVSIVAGFHGLGYWALVLGSCALPLSTSVGAWVMCRWTPGRPRRTGGLRTMLMYAMNTYGRFSVNYATRNGDNLLVGWRFGSNALGFYKKAYDLFSLSAGQLVSATTVVAVSALSRVRKDQPRYQRYLLGAITVMAFLGMGLSGGLTLIGRDLIRILLGPGWDRAGQIFTYFAPGIGAMIIYQTHGWVHLSIGRADRWFRWGILELVVTLALFIAGLHWGPEGVAVAWCISFWILTIPAMSYAGRPITLGARVVVAVVWRYIIASSVAAATSACILSRFAILRSMPGFQGAAFRIWCLGSLFVVLYLAGIVLLYGGFAPLQKLLDILLQMLPSSEEGRADGTSREALLETSFGSGNAARLTRIPGEDVSQEQFRSATSDT